LSDRLFETVEDNESPSPSLLNVKAKLKNFNVSGGDKLFRDGKEIDPQTGQPYSPLSEEKPIKLEDQTMSENPETDNAPASTEEPSTEEAAPAAEPEEAPAAEADAKASSEVESLKAQVADMSSKMEVLMKALKQPVNGATAEDAIPQAEIKSQRPARVLDLCF